MWPMLFELLPHFTRLLPMADKYLSSRSGDDRAHAAALAALSESVRGDLQKSAEMHAGVERALKQQSALVGEIAAEGLRVRLGVEAIEGRFAGLEKMLRLTLGLLAAVVLLLGVAVVLLVVVLAHLGHR
jgi:hypothetical protein